MSKLLIIDGNAIAHRAYHAIPELTNKKGEHTNAVYGFVSILITLISNLKPTHIIATFDEKEVTFRRKEYEGYQAKRPKMDDWLSSQLVLIREWLTAAHIPYFSKGGYEADDVIGTIVNVLHNRQKKTDNGETIIVTGDRDIFQLISDRVKVYVPIKGLKEGKLYGIKEVKEEFDFAPVQMVDYKALVGDSSDNYPGVAGIGPKTARDLIVKYRTVENIYQKLNNIPLKIQKKLEAGKKDAFFFHKLATIFSEVPIKFNLNQCSGWNITSDSSLAFMKKMGFKSLLFRLEKQQLNLI